MLRFARCPFVLRETDRSRLTSGPSLNPRVGLAKLKRNVNDIGVRSFVLSGAPIYDIARCIGPQRATLSRAADTVRDSDCRPPRRSAKVSHH